jgi:hypothetical protein
VPDSSLPALLTSAGPGGLGRLSAGRGPVSSSGAAAMSTNSRITDSLFISNTHSVMPRSGACMGRGYRLTGALGYGRWRSDCAYPERVSAGKSTFQQVVDGRPQQDSNLRTRLRRPLLYPLSYGGWRNTRISLRHAGCERGSREPDRSQRTRRASPTPLRRSAPAGRTSWPEPVASRRDQAPARGQPPAGSCPCRR